MRNTAIALIVFAVLFAASVTAQTVTITGQKKTYTRVKPISGYKKTFTINRPLAKASTAALSRKITSLLDPVNVLEIDLKEELTETQWLSEADFEEVFNEQGVLTVMLWMEGSAAYSDGVTKYVVVDVANGVRLVPASVFVDLPGLTAAIKKKQDAEIEKAIKTIKADPEFAADDDPKRLFEETTFEEKDLVNFAVDRAGVAFFYDYGFPNVIKALEPEGELRLSWSEIKPFHQTRRFARKVCPLIYLGTNQMSDRKIRVLVAKPGLDGHDRGAKVIARALRDAGMEVIYTGLRQTPEMIAAAAVQEDVDAVGISILSGAHKTLCPRIVNLLRENGMDDTLVLVGGIVPNEDIADLKSQGISEVFLPGTSTEDIVTYIREHVRADG